MATQLTQDEIDQRIEQGRRIRYEMERRGVSAEDLMTRFKKSYPAIRLALRTHQLPGLRVKIEQFVMGKKPVSRAA